MDLLDSKNDSFPIWGEQADDLQEVPYDDPSANEFSFKRLFPIIYSKDPVSGGKFIERGLFNGILKAITTMIHNLGMTRGMIPYHEDYAADKGYPLGSRVVVLYDNLTGALVTPSILKQQAQVDDISYEERRAFCESLLVESMIDKNKQSPLILKNLYKYWRVVDGRHFGDLLYRGVNLSEETFTPPGYLDLGYAPPEEGGELLYNLEDYPRVATFLKLQNAQRCSYFQKHGDDKFKITNMTGLFARVYNNNYMQTNLVPRDPARSFTEIQDDASHAIIGAVALLGYVSSLGGSSYGTLENQAVRARVWMPVTQLDTKHETDPKYAHFKDLKKYNAFKPIISPTTYSIANQNYQYYGYDYSTFYSSSYESTKAVTSDVLTIDTSDNPKTAHEVRPKNFAVKLYIKV